MKKMRNLIATVVLGAALVFGLGAETATKVDLNSANQKQLETLPGIGPALADRIIKHRTKNGRFKRIEDLMNVKGIGEKKFLKLKEMVYVKQAPGKPAKKK
jgi:competence protein ComEA